MKYDDLTVVAKLNCMTDYLTVLFPYDTAGDWDNASIDDLEESIRCTLENEEFSIDDKGHWYFDGEEVR